MKKKPGNLFTRLAAALRPAPPSLAAGAGAEGVGTVLAGWLDGHRRTCWLPQVAEREGAPCASRFGGRPWLAAAEPWPACTGCGKPLSPFVQLDLASLPGDSGLHGAGLLQLFSCVADGCTAEAWAPFGGGQLARVVHPGAGAHLPGAPPQGAVLMPAREITGWEARDDWPSWAEHEEQGLDVEYLQHPRRTRLTWRERGVSVEVQADEALEAVPSAAAGDKLGGWPAWVQGVEYPACPRCGERMALLLQVDSEDHLPWMFGDSGCGHVTRCPRHPEVVAFGWACC